MANEEDVQKWLEIKDRREAEALGSSNVTTAFEALTDYASGDDVDDTAGAEEARTKPQPKGVYWNPNHKRKKVTFADQPRKRRLWTN
jgi:hypothetical protein